jgi:hypothetical protein
MTNFDQLMGILTVPRPNGSRAERQTSLALQNWLRERGIPYRVHTFTHYPYFFECIGVFLILSRLLLALAIWLRWGWPALPIALLGLVGATVDQAFHIPLVTWPGRKRGENILVQFSPQDPKQELFISAHYDSKTELLDHNQRMFFLKSLPVGIALTLILGLLGPLDARLLAQASPWAGWTYWTGVALSLPLLFLALGLGLNMSLGRLVQPSPGAVDNGTACAILLGLAERLQNGQIPIENTRLTLALFTGEEVNLQGSRAYARGREFPLPSAALNLEAMAQDGDYVFWERDGSIFKLVPTSEPVNRLLREVVREVTGAEPVPGGPVISDGASFLTRGVPTGVLGTYHSVMRDSGFHRPSDNLSRVDMSRLPQGVELLARFLHKYDHGRLGQEEGFNANTAN